MSTSSSSETLDIKTSSEPISDPSIKNPEESETNGEEEEGECGFCLFMKGGGCKDRFVDWEKCIEEAEENKEDIVDKCFEVTGALKKCMEAHSEYYAPILQAEKAAVEREKESLEGSDTQVHDHDDGPKILQKD